MRADTGLTIVTGASSGIGRSLARRLAADGEPVALLARRGELLDSLADEIRASGGRAVAVVCDVTDPVAVRNAVRVAEEQFGPTARLVANAVPGEEGGRFFRLLPRQAIDDPTSSRMLRDEGLQLALPIVLGLDRDLDVRPIETEHNRFGVTREELC